MFGGTHAPFVKRVFSPYAVCDKSAILLLQETFVVNSFRAKSIEQNMRCIWNWQGKFLWCRYIFAKQECLYRKVLYACIFR